MQRQQKPKLPLLHYNRAKAVSCPVCKAEAGKLYIRSDGKNGGVHRERVLRYEMHCNIIARSVMQ
jgi:hypothetical protein